MEMERIALSQRERVLIQGSHSGFSFGVLIRGVLIRRDWTVCLVSPLRLSKPPFAGKTHGPAESLVRALRGLSILALGQGRRPHWRPAWQRETQLLGA
jgi:hypothetical protein